MKTPTKSPVSEGGPVKSGKELNLLLERTIRKELPGLLELEYEQLTRDVASWTKACELLENGACFKSPQDAAGVAAATIGALRNFLEPLLLQHEHSSVHWSNMPLLSQTMSKFACESSLHADIHSMRNFLKELVHISHELVNLAVEFRKSGAENPARFVLRVAHACLEPMSTAFDTLTRHEIYLCQPFVQVLQKIVLLYCQSTKLDIVNGQPRLWFNIIEGRLETPEESLVWQLVDHMAIIIASAWSAHPEQAQQELYFLEIVSEDKFLILAIGHSVMKKLDGHESLSRMLIPLFMDMMSLQTKDIGVVNYAFASHVLSSMGAICANNGNFWGYVSVVDQFTKLFKFPKHKISSALLYGEVGEEKRRSSKIRGKSPGSLAEAFLNIAKRMNSAPISFRKDFRRRILMLFSDFALLMPNDSYIADLGSLLPAIAAAVSNIKASFVMGRISSALSSGDLSLDTLSKLQEEGRIQTSAFRHLWFCSAVYDFASLRPDGGDRSWPHEWSNSLARIASRSPVLLLGSEQQQESVFLDHIGAEFGGWLAPLGRRSESRYLIECLSLSFPDSVARLSNISMELCCHLVTISYAALCHSKLEDAPDYVNRSPLDAIIVHSQFSLPRSVEYTWYKEILRKSFSIYVSHLTDLSRSSDTQNEDFALHAAGYLAEVLIESLVQQGPNDDVPLLMIELLKSLLPLFPCLYFSKDIINGAIRSVTTDRDRDDGKEKLTASSLVADPREVSSQSIASKYLLHMLEEAASRAPLTTEAVIAENLRRLSEIGGSSADFSSTITPAVMSAIEMGRSRCSLPDSTGTFKGILAWSAKVRALGLVDGLRLSIHSDEEVFRRLCQELLKKVRHRSSSKDISDGILELAAACISIPFNEIHKTALQLLAWTPLLYLEKGVMQASCLAWNWILATESELGSYLMSNLTSAWTSIENSKIGIFRVDTDKRLSSVFISEEEILEVQRLWIVFLTEVLRSRYQSNLSSHHILDGDFVRIAECAHGTVDNSPLGCNPAMCSARFRLLCFILEYLLASHKSFNETEKRSGQSMLSRVFEDVINAGFAWFTVQVTWHQTSSREAAEDYRAVEHFFLLVGKTFTVLIQDYEIASTEASINLLLFLLETERERLRLWSSPISESSGQQYKPIGGWERTVLTAWSISRKLALNLGSRFRGVKTVQRTLQRLVIEHARDSDLQQLPEAVSYLAVAPQSEKKRLAIGFLKDWTPTSLEDAMCLMALPISRDPSAFEYIIKCLELCNPKNVSFFLPQLVQLLRHDPEKGIESFLLKAASRSSYFAFLLKCQLIAEGTPPAEAFNPEVRRSNWSPPTDTGLWTIADTTLDQLKNSLHGDVRNHLEAESLFFDSVTAVSGKLYPVAKEERKAAAVRFLREIKVQRNDLFMPFDSNTIIRGIKPETAAPMQSAAKCPILVAFDVVKKLPESEGQETEVETTEAAIFKVGDDCRQDVLALQVVELVKKKFDEIGLPLPLVPYGVLPTGHECGIIQVVPNSKSRAQLGEVTDGGLLDVFQNEFGLPGSARFESARSAFIESSAAYAVVSYLLQAKDRHNGNIMIDNLGRIIHIDFGYIFGISPGGNMGFESAAFKLSYEMTELLDPGNTRKSIHFLRFQELCVKGYLAARTIADSIVATVQMMTPSKLPCFSRGMPIESLRERFHLEMSDTEAATFMRSLILDAYDKWTTGVYDLIQYYQNRIPK